MVLPGLLAFVFGAVGKLTKMRSESGPDRAARLQNIPRIVPGYWCGRRRLGMAAPAERFSTAKARAEQDLPAAAAAVGHCPDPVLASPAADPPAGPAASLPAPGLAYRGGPVEFERVVPPSGNMEVRARQFWLGTARAGMVVTFWASVDVIHLTIGAARVKSVRSHLSTADLTRLAADGGQAAGPPPIPATEPGAAIEVDRVVSKDGHVSLGGRYHIAAEILGGQLVSIRIEDSTLMFFDPATRVLLRTRPSPLTWDQARLLRGARPAGPPRAPQPSRSPSSAGPATPA